MSKRKKATIKFVLCSIVGICVFFITFNINGKDVMIVDYFATALRDFLGVNIQKYIVLFTTFIGVIMPVYIYKRKRAFNSVKDVIFYVFKIIGFVCAIFYVFAIGPRTLLDNSNLLPYLFNTLCCNLCFLIPIGSIFLSFLTKYGLMEFCSVFLQPLMRKIWKVPGRSAIDVLASYMGSYSVALVITDDMYNKGYYTKKEAFIIATGFSTVTASFLVLVAKNLNIMDYWNLYFISTMIITFVVTAIVIRFFPTVGISNEYKDDVEPKKEEKVEGKYLRKAWEQAIDTAEKSDSVLNNNIKDFKTGCFVVTNVIPSILSIGLIGIILAEYTHIFDYIGLIFYPFLLLVRSPEALELSKIISLTIVDMFLPVSYASNMSLVSRYIIGVTCVSGMLFFSSVIPCMLSTRIPIKLWQLLVIWVERVIFSIIISGVFALLIF